jgi:hypothetical protein
MNGTCLHCGETGTLWRYRLADVGLRWLLPACFERLSAMGLCIEAVTSEPRSGDRRSEDRGGRRASDVRSGLRWLIGRAA